MMCQISKILTSTSTKYICGNHGISLSAKNLLGTGINSYQWNYGISGLSDSSALLTDAPGMYKVMVTDTNGCKGYDTITIVKASKCGLCKGSHDTITLDAGTGYTTYNWNADTLHSHQINVNNPGRYIVHLAGINNFSAIDTIYISTDSLPDINILTATGMNYLCGSDSLMLLQQTHLVPGLIQLNGIMSYL